MGALSKAGLVLSGALCAVALASPGAQAIGDEGNREPSTDPSGTADGNTLTASATTTGIKVTQVSGSGSGTSPKALAPVDPNWEPPACWYEPVATPEQLKAAVDRLKKGGDLVAVPSARTAGSGAE